MSVRELLERVDAMELVEWMRYWELECFGDEWEQTAAICETIALSHGHKDITRNAWRPVPKKPRQQTKAEMEAEIAKIGQYFKQVAQHKKKKDGGGGS